MGGRYVLGVDRGTQSLRPAGKRYWMPAEGWSVRLPERLAIEAIAEKGPDRI